MRAIFNVLCAAALVLILSAGLLGAVSAAIPATGLVIGPALVWVMVRHRMVGLVLLLGALRGTLEMESWPEAREVVHDARWFGLLAGGTASAGSVGAVLLLAPELIELVGLQVILHAASPLIVAAGLAVTLWTPLDRALSRGYDVWLGALREALTPVAKERAPIQKVRTA